MTLPNGIPCIVLDETTSTNDEARRHAEAGAGAPLWIMSHRQTAGRGRQGRRWDDPGGNLFASCLLRPAMPPAQAALHSFAAALAVADVCEVLAPGVPVALKWPNDVLLKGRKVSGILLESGGGGPTIGWLVVGIGLNLAAAPPAHRDGWPPTSIAAETAAAPAPALVLDRLAAAFDHWATLLEVDGFAPLRTAWLARAARLGENIVARLPNETVEGVFEGIDASGALVLAQGARRRAIGAADVFFG